jgi:hypothetical protein
MQNLNKGQVFVRHLETLIYTMAINPKCFISYIDIHFAFYTKEHESNTKLSCICK